MNELIDAERPLKLSPLLARLSPYLAAEAQPVYLVGGAVRDALLGRVSHDLDFVVAQDAISLSFRIGDAIAAPAYVLDRERDTGRVVLPEENTVLDFSRFRGEDLAADLRDRDFTINAVALPATAVERSAIIDPTNGLADLAARKIHLTHAGSLIHDPVRCLRAVRLATDLDFTISPDTRTAVIAAAPHLAGSTAERTRDELLKMMSHARRTLAVEEMAALELLPVVLPEIADLAEVPQSPPHHEPVLAHTISVLRWLEAVEAALRQPAETVPDPVLGAVRRTLEPYAAALLEHLARPLDGGVDGVQILYFAALFHDVGKAQTLSLAEDGRYRFYGHDEAGAVLVEKRLRALALSNEAVAQVRRIVAEHMRPLLLAQSQGATPSRRAVFRFFRATEANGLDVGLLALADHLATHGGPGPADAWATLLALVQTLFGHYFEQYTVTVQPPPLLNGRDLMAALDLQPGPQIGRLLRLIEEGQAAGEITTREEALRFAAAQAG